MTPGSDGLNPQFLPTKAWMGLSGWRGEGRSKICAFIMTGSRSELIKGKNAIIGFGSQVTPLNGAMPGADVAVASPGASPKRAKRRVQG